VSCGDDDVPSGYCRGIDYNPHHVPFHATTPSVCRLARAPDAPLASAAVSAGAGGSGGDPVLHDEAQAECMVCLVADGG